MVRRPVDAKNRVQGTVVSVPGQAGRTRPERKRRASASVPCRVSGQRERKNAMVDGARRTAGRAVPRRFQPEQHDVPVRRRRETRGRVAVRHGHRPVRVAGAGSVLLSVHEHGPAATGRALGSDAGRVLCAASSGRVGLGRGIRTGTGPSAVGRRNARVRVLRAGARVVFLALHDGGKQAG